MHANECLGHGTDTVDLPTVDNTIAAMAVLGRILDELRARLATAERAVVVLENENLALRAELRALADDAARRPVCLPSVQPQQAQPWNAPLEEAMLAFIKGVDTSFGRAAAQH